MSLRHRRVCGKSAGVERNRKGEEDRNGRYREGAGDTGDRDDQEGKGSSESVKSYDTESGRIHSGVENKEKQSAQMHDSAGDEKKESAQVHDSAGDEEENGTTHKLNRAKSEDRQESAAETNDTGKDDGEKESAKATGGIVGSDRNLPPRHTITKRTKISRNPPQPQQVPRKRQQKGNPQVQMPEKMSFPF